MSLQVFADREYEYADISNFSVVKYKFNEYDEHAWSDIVTKFSRDYAVPGIYYNVYEAYKFSFNDSDKLIANNCVVELPKSDVLRLAKEGKLVPLVYNDSYLYEALQIGENSDSYVHSNITVELVQNVRKINKNSIVTLNHYVYGVTYYDYPLALMVDSGVNASADYFLNNINSEFPRPYLRFDFNNAGYYDLLMYNSLFYSVTGIMYDGNLDDDSSQRIAFVKFVSYMNRLINNKRVLDTGLETELGRNEVAMKYGYAHNVWLASHKTYGDLRFLRPSEYSALPLWGNDYYINANFFLAIPKSCKYQDLAKLYVNYLILSDNMIYFTDESMATPVSEVVSHRSKLLNERPQYQILYDISRYNSGEISYHINEENLEHAKDLVLVVKLLSDGYGLDEVFDVITKQHHQYEDMAVLPDASETLDNLSKSPALVERNSVKPR